MLIKNGPSLRFSRDVSRVSMITKSAQVPSVVLQVTYLSFRVNVIRECMDKS